MQMLQVENQNISHAKTNKTELAMGGVAETKDVANSETKDVAKSERKDVANSETKDVANNESRKEDQPQTPMTFELRKNGYLALARGLGSGVYEANGLTSQASVGLEFFGLRNRDIAGGFGDDVRSFRQSSIDSEPNTLTTVSVRRAKDGAVEIIDTYDEEEAIHLFLKDAEDENLREEALAAILPVDSELVT